MTRPRLKWGHLALAVAIAVAGAGCGNSSASLTGPSGSGGGSGARITGRVSGISGLAAMAPATAIRPMAETSVRVTINGTGLSTTVDGNGNFTLTEVPPGTVQLTFSGPGLNASITLSGVQDGDQIQVEVRIEGGSAKIQFEVRHHENGEGDEVEGRITAIDASARTLRVAGLLITVPESAKIHRDSRSLLFSDLVVGQEVEVHGTREGTGFRATEIEVEDHDD
jgi:uncharacterized protein DUF5666/carboxypeptidase family protein